MAIRKDLDDILNSLMDNSGSGSPAPAKSHTTSRAVRKTKFDNMSVDDLLHALEAEKNHITAEEPAAAPTAQDEQPATWEFAPPPHDIPVPDPVSDEPSDDEKVPNIIAEVMHTEASAEATRVFDSIPMTAAEEELPKPAKKKKIVITGELPDYEALRREELEREKQAKLAAEAAAEEARAAEKLRIEAEERARRIAEAADKKRMEEEAERRRAEEAEQMRMALEADAQRKAQEAVEKQRRIDEMKRLAEEAAAVSEPTAVTFTEETIVNSSSIDEVDEAIGSLGEAAEAHIEEEATEEKPKKVGFFKKLIGKSKDEEEVETAPEDGLFENDSEPSATDLIDAAIAAINNER